MNGYYIALPLSVLFASVIVWFFLVSGLFRRLRSQHPDKFREMGEPSLFMNNSPRTTIALMKFMFGRQDRELDDPGLSKLTVGMLWFFFCYFVVFISLFGIVATGAFVHFGS